MGKNNKKDAKADMRWRTGMLNKKEREAMERYGLSTSNYGWDKSDNPGRYSGGDYDDMRQDFLRAASNDYDTRRGIEAMAMSGNEKAENIAKSGMSTVQNVMLANKLQKKEHKKAGNGGNFSSLSDFAGTSYRSVQADRNNFIEDNDTKYASKADLASMKDKMEDDPGQARQATEGMSFNDYMEGTFGSKYEDLARGPAPYTDGDMDGGTAIPTTSETSTGETAASAAAQSNLADTVAGLSEVGGASANKHKMGMYAFGSLTGGV